MPERYLGRLIGKYRVIRLLGGGAFAWVYEAVDRDLEIPVALKILRPEFAGQTEAEARFRREASTAARLRHPNIVTVRDVGQVDGASFVAMDLLPLSLARRLELLPRLPEADVVRIGLDVAAALAVAHAGGIVHRDIKPDNILIGTRGEAVVADFGLARALDGGAALSGSNQVMGTPHYFSPEQARGLDLDGRSDLYALGVTLFRSATGRLPFEGDDWYAVARLHVEAPIPSARASVPELSVAFDAVVMRLLSKAPSERFASALELADALATLPSAPTPLSMAAVSRGASETVTTFPALPESVPRAHAPRRWLGVTVGAAALGIAAWLAMQSADVRALLGIAPRLPVVALSDTASSAPGDSTRGGTADSTISVANADTQPAVSPPKAAGPRAKPASTARASLTLSAPDSAMLYVDGVFVGRGTARVERSAASRLVLKAVIADAPANCAPALRDSAVRITPGEERAIVLSVRTCIGVRFDVEPKDARLRFDPLGGGTAVEVRADTASSVLLPAGRYELTVSARRCITYEHDTVDAVRGASATARSRFIRLPCS